jgi:dCMP deaminase
VAQDVGAAAPAPGRPDWDDYFLGIAAAVSARADCRRRRVGAVLVANNRIVATGYNGAPSGGPSCLAGECPRGLQDPATVAPGSSYDTGAGACVALHAEQNCLLYADRSRAESATIYVTHEPCEGCRRMIAGSGVTRAVWPGGLWQVR